MSVFPRKNGLKAVETLNLTMYVLWTSRCLKGFSYRREIRFYLSYMPIMKKAMQWMGTVWNRAAVGNGKM